MPTRQTRMGAYTALYTTDLSCLLLPHTYVAATTKTVIYCHGHGADATQILPGNPPGSHVSALLAAGYAVLGVDHARINSYGDPDAMRALDDAYTYQRSTIGLLGSTKIGFLGWSMGGLTALNWIKRNPSLVACAWLFNPCTDTKWLHDAAGAYTPAYSLGGVAQGAYTAEVDATFSTSSAAVGAYTIAASGGAGITMTITTSTGKGYGDGNNQANVGKPQATVNGVAFTYTSKTDSTLVGCVSTTGSTIAVTNGMAITSSYAAQSNGYRVVDEPTQWAANGVNVKVCQASDDTTIPPAQNTDGTNGFVAKVGSGNVTLRSPNPTGGHTLSLGNVPASEVLAFFQANL